MKVFKNLFLGLLVSALAVSPLAAQGNGNGNGKPGGSDGDSAVVLETTHFMTDSSANPVNIHWSDQFPISEANDGHEITFDRHGTYKMTMHCADPGDCSFRSFVILVPASGSCPEIDWPEARMSIRVDNVESVDTGTVSRSGWAQIRELVNGEAVGVLYTLNWDNQDGADLINVTGDGTGTSWTIEVPSGGLANMQVPSGKGNKTEVCGLVQASFSLDTTRVIN